MGSPKRLRKKYETPAVKGDSLRIKREHEIRDKYGLKNLREVWIVESELRRIRKNVREILAGRESEETGKQIIQRLSRYGIVRPDATLDELLSLSVDSLLERRLQTIVVKKGLARTLAQSRQLITHGFIAVNGRKVTTPSYFVPLSEENAISHYKPIDINAGIKQQSLEQQAAATAASTASSGLQAHEEDQAQSAGSSSNSAGEADKQGNEVS